MGLLNKLEKNNIVQEIKKQRKDIHKQIKKIIKKDKKVIAFVKTGINGLDALFEKGIPKTSSILIAGGAGSGKTILALQTMVNVANIGGKCLYISLEESEEKLIDHMDNFNWHPLDLMNKNLIIINRVDPFKLARSVEALLAKAKGELKIDIANLGKLIPENFKPDWIIIDSLTALSAAFREGEDSYRIYIEQLFRYFENIKVTSMLISETDQVPVRYSKTGVEEFLADGVIVLYHIKKGNIRERAIEVLKVRGAKHEEKIVAMKINENGIEVYPEQEVFSDIKEE